MNVSEYLMQQVADLGVKFVPLYQSGNALKLIDEAGKNSSIEVFIPYHEQTVAMATEAYARFNGFGVGIVGTGPAASNLVTGIMSAFVDSIPCLFFTGQVGNYHAMKGRAVRQRGFQELDVEALMRPITKYSKLVSKAEDIKYEFEKAVYLAKSGRPGPVVLDIPFDVQHADINPDELRGFDEPVEEHTASEQQFNDDYQSIYDELLQAERPLLLLGGGIRLADQVENIRKLTQALRIPVVTTWAGADYLDYNDELNVGNVGRSGNRSAIAAVQECDYLLAMGTRFTTKTVIDDVKFAKDAKITAIDIDSGELEDGLVEIDHKINRDLKEFIPSFGKFFEEHEFPGVKSDWVDHVRELKSESYMIDDTLDTPSSDDNPLSPYSFMRTLFEELREDAIVIPDAGLNLAWTYQGHRIKVGQRLFAALGGSPMGYALPGAIGAYYANKNSQIVSITGDGGIQMNIQELQAFAFNKIPVKIFVMNNESLGNTRFPAVSMFGRSTGNDAAGGYGVPDFGAVAESYGLESHVLDGKSDLAPALRKILDSKNPCLINVKIDVEQFVLDTTLN